MLSKKDKQGLLLIAGVLLVLIAIFAVKLNLDAKPKPGADNCVGPILFNTVVVLDHSERITDQTSDEIIARAMTYIHANVKVNERVSIFTISDLSKAALKPLVSLCRPPDDGNRVTEYLPLIHKRFEQNFEQPIRDVLKLVPGNEKESPIAQTIIDISLSQYLRGSANTLLIFSDMLENTAKFSLYRCTSGGDAIPQYRASRRGAKERPDFKNTKVVLNLIPRLNQGQGTLQCRDQLWTWFFGDNSGAQAGLSFDYLPGGGK